MDADCNGHSSNAAVYRSAAANIIIAVFKIAGGIATGSPAMISEGIHSIVDTSNQALLLVGRWLAKKPADEKHPLGYGNAPVFLGVIIATFIFYTGAGLSAYEGYHGWIHAQAVNYTPFMWGAFGYEVAVPRVAVPVCIIIAAMVFETWALSGAVRELRIKFPDKSVYTAMRYSKDPADLILVFEDTAALVGLTIAMVGVSMSYITADARWDAGASMLIAVLLAVVAIVLLLKLYSLQIGESATPNVRQRITDIIKWSNLLDHERDGDELRERPGIERINELITIHQGPNDILVIVSFDPKDKLTAKHIEALVSQIDRDIKEAVPDVHKVVVEAQSYVSHMSILHEDEEGETEGDEHERFDFLDQIPPRAANA